MPVEPTGKCPDIYPGITPKGWQLTANNTGLNNAGVIDKNNLPIYSEPLKPPSGTVITERKIIRQLDLSNGNIIIERCFIQPQQDNFGPGVSLLSMDINSPAPVIIRDCDIDGSLISDNLIAYVCAFLGGGTLERNNIYNTGSGIAIISNAEFDILVENNFVHDLRGYGNPTTTGSHNEAFTIRSFQGDKAIIRNNRFECTAANNATAAFFIQPYSGFINNVVIIGNLMITHGGYVLILERNTSSFQWGTCISAVNNRLEYDVNAYGNGYVDSKANGPSTAYATWKDNYVYDPSAIDTKGVEANVFIIPY